MDGCAIGWGTEVACPCRRTGHIRRLTSSQILTQPLIVTKDEHFVLLDRPSCRCAKLISPEGRDFPRGIKKVFCIHGAVAKELVGGSMELVRSRLGDGVDDAARGLSVLR